MTTDLNNQYRNKLNHIRRAQWKHVFVRLCAWWHWDCFLPGLPARLTNLWFLMARMEYWLALRNSLSEKELSMRYWHIVPSREEYRERVVYPHMCDVKTMLDTRIYCISTELDLVLARV